MEYAPLDAPAKVFSSYKGGFGNLTKAFLVLVLLSLVSLIPGAIGQISNFVDAGVGLELGLAGGSFLLTILVFGPLGYGVVYAHLKVSRGEEAKFSDLFHVFRQGLPRYLQAVLLTLLVTLMVAFGFVLLIIPGIYLAVKVAFTGVAFVEQDLDAFDAIKASFDRTKGYFWRIVGFYLVSFLVFILGALVLLVGAFVASAWVQQASVVLYQRIGHEKAA